MTSSSRPSQRWSPSARRPAPSLSLLAALAVPLVAIVGCGDSDSDDDGSDPVPQMPKHAIAAGDRPVVYASGAGEQFHLWLMSETGGDRVQLTRGEGAEAGPVWSPDGSRIAFFAAGGRTDDFDLWVIDADGTELRRLTDTDDVWEGVPSWSPDGRHLVYDRSIGGPDEGGEVRILDVDDPEAEQSTVAELGDWPSWSPDGNTIVYGGEADGTAALFTVPASGGEATQLGAGLPPGAGEPSWSPDGTQIAFAATSGDPNAKDPVAWNEDIWVMDADGTHARKVVAWEGNDHWRQAWSPDGQHLMFTADGAENEGEIARVDLITGDLVALTDNNVQDLMPSWRPTD